MITKCSPNYLMLGREEDFPIDSIAGNPSNYDDETCVVEYVEFVQEAMASAFQHAGECLQSSFQKQKRYHDENLKHRSFIVGDLVWRWYPPWSKQKLGLGWRGPYKVTRKISTVTYQIQCCQKMFLLWCM